MERPKCNKDDIEQCTLFWNAKNYEEYALSCDMKNLPRVWDKTQFESLRNFFDRCIDATINSLNGI